MLLLLAVGFGALALFVLLESRQRLPMLDLSLFRNPTFAGANTVMALVGLAMFGVFFYNSLFIQNVLGYSADPDRRDVPADDAADHVRRPGGGEVHRPDRPALADGRRHVAPRPLSLILFGTLDESSTFWGILPGLLVGGLGMAITMAPTTAAAMSSVPIAKAGVGSAVINSMRQVGGSLGIAVMGTIVAASVSVGQRSPAYTAQFVDGYHRALLVGAGVLLAGAVVAVLAIRPAVRVEPEVVPAETAFAVATFEEAA